LTHIAVSGLQHNKKPSSDLLIGVSAGVIAALGWAAGFVVAKHGIEIGFTPADLAFHRFAWTGIFMLPIALSLGIRNFGGVGWGRSLVIFLLAGPTQALLAYSGFLLVPLGHGTVIQPACATLFGLFLAAIFLRDKLTTRRIVGAAIIISGLLVLGAEALTTIGAHGVGGDLLFASAGILWAVFGTLLRQWQIPGIRAALVIGGFSVLLMAPAYLLLFGYQHFLQLGWFENLLQIFVQGLLAGALPIYLFGIAVTRLGAGRAATFTSLVPGFALVLGYIGMGSVPSLPQLVGLIVVAAGFQVAVRH
jgi:drug/metabolite transporter (DMT)-like permease